MYLRPSPGVPRRNLLKAFYFYERNGGREPQRIVFFWDGVSDGQFQNVLDEKVAAIKKVRPFGL